MRVVRETATPRVLAEIAGGDSQGALGDEAKHADALQALFDEYDCRLNRQPNNAWYPCEPVELIAFAVDGHSVTAQAVCNLLLMIEELEDGGRYDVNYLWFQTPGEAWFRALAPKFRDPLLAGFEVLHAEMSDMEREHWDGQTIMDRLRQKKDAQNG